MSDSDIAVYCRLLQLKTLKNDQIAYAVQTLKQLLDTLVSKYPGAEHRSSVYGRFAILKPYPEKALEFADELRRQATEAKVALGIGIAQGRIEPTYDLFGGNVAGNPINYAARLAFLRDTECRIAAEPEFVRAIRQTSSKSKKQFGEEKTEHCKRIQLKFHFLGAQGGILPASPPGLDCTNETAHVVAVDIVKYSKKPLREMMQAAAHLLQFNVRGPIEATGGVYHEFAPGGDGGIFVFRPSQPSGSAKAAWRFLRDLRDGCEDSVEVRFGVTSGPVVVLEGGYPVGHGILEADELSSLPPTGQVCSSKEFWDRKLDEFDRKGWTPTVVEKRPDAYLLIKTGQSNSTTTVSGITDIEITTHPQPAGIQPQREGAQSMKHPEIPAPSPSAPSRPTAPKVVVVVATGWGSASGGINAFNFDFCQALGQALRGQARLICLTTAVSDLTKQQFQSAGVELLTLPAIDPDAIDAFGRDAQTVLRAAGIDRIELTIGHDVFTGPAALRLKADFGGTAAVIHHMNYGSYHSVKSDGEITRQKEDQQRNLFTHCDHVLAIGPSLKRDIEALSQRQATMLVPGIADIQPISLREGQFRAITFGRMGGADDLIKQGRLAAAAFGRFVREVTSSDRLAFDFKYRLSVFGIPEGNYKAEAAALRELAEQHADAMLNVVACPYTENRADLFKALRENEVALMLSWYEGFGLVGWEAISAGVPLIVSKQSGLYRLLRDEYGSLIEAIDIRGSSDGEPNPTDLTTVSDALCRLASNLPVALDRAARLRTRLAQEYTWERCARETLKACDWNDAERPASAPAFPAVEVPPLGITAPPLADRVDAVLATYCEILVDRWNTQRGDPHDPRQLNHYLANGISRRIKPWEKSAEEAKPRHAMKLEAESAEESAYQAICDPHDGDNAKFTKFFALGNRILLTEDAGAGKSVFTERLQAWLSSAEPGEGQATLFNGRAPLVVRWEGGRQPWPTRVGAETAAAAYQRAVVDAVRETMAPLATQHALSVEQVVAEAFALGRVVLLLDAFDQLAGESARAQEETLRGWLDTPMEPRPKSAQIRVLVTSRDSAVVPHTHPEGHFAFERWAHVRLDGFTERQQLLYLRDLIEQHTGIPTHNPEVWSAALEGRKLKDEWRGPAERIVLTDAECFGAVYATVTELLKVPVLLRFVRDLARDSARFPKFANRADLYFQATNHLFVRNLTLPNVPKVEHDQYIVWFRELLSAVAFQMMCDAPGRYQIEGSVAVSDLKRAAQRRMGDSETQAKWAELFGLSGTVAGLTRYLIVEQSSHSAFGWKHRGMMEFYAGLFLARNTQAGWIPDRSATQSGPADTGLCGDETLRGSVGDPRWEWPFRFAMELSACQDSDARQWVQAPILGASLSTLFEVPQGNRRPTELMWRALSLAYPRRGQWRAYDQWLAGYQSQFESILLEESDLKRATIAAQLVPIDMLEEYRRTGRLTPERFAAIQPGTEPAFVPCPPPGWKHPTEPDRDPCVFWQGSATNAAESYDREKPRHPVRVAPFWMQSTTVTVEQYGLFDLQHAVDFEQSLNSTACEPDCPIIEVDWHDAALFALWVQARLPTESEWEFAARAGRDAADEYFGIPCDGRFDRLTSQQANFNGKYPFGEKQANDRQAYFEATLPVRWTAVRRAALLRQADGPTREKLGKFDAYVANAWALWQMHGNVWEWCADAFVEQAYVNRSRQLLRDCVGDGDRVGKMTPAELTVELERQFRDHLPALRTALQAMISSEQAIEGRLYSAGLSRVLRGGSWNDHGRRLRCAYRNLDHPDARGRGCGFRLCRGSVVRVESSSR